MKHIFIHIEEIFLERDNRKEYLQRIQEHFDGDVFDADSLL